MNVGSVLRAVFASRGTVVWLAGCLVLAVFLFATRPPELPAETTSGRKLPIEKVFRILAAENDVARSMYTAEIVTAGQKVGLVFDERWRDQGHEAGPLPALFLREAASSVSKTTVPLGLFLGSDSPISQSNQFKGAQADHFRTVRTTTQPDFFFASDLNLYTAMFPDYAVGAGCVSCHNEHPESPKHDWKLNDMMGATTWSYPSDRVTPEEMVQMLSVLRAGFARAYDAYLTKAAQFNRPPEVGATWPRDGYALPSGEVFMREFEQRASAATVKSMLDAVNAD